MRRRLFSALTAIALGSGLLLVSGTSADAAIVTMSAGGVTYRADDATRAAGATVVSVDATAPKTLVLPTTVTIQGRTYDVTSVAGGAAQGLGLTSLTLPSRLVTIGESAFLSNQLTALVLPSTVTIVDNDAFVDNRLSSLTLSSSLLTIGEGVFAGNQLTSVALPASLRVIDSGAFVTNKLTSVTIPAGVTVIDDAAFADNPLSSVTFTGPPPTTFTPATPAGGAPIGSLGTGTGLTVSYPAAFAAPGYANGFTSPTWKGYAAQSVGATTPPTVPPTTPPTAVPGLGLAKLKITRVKTRRKAGGKTVFRISVVNVGSVAVPGTRVIIKNRPHAVTYPDKKAAVVGTLAVGASRTVSIRARIRTQARTKFIFKALSDNAPRATSRVRLAPRRVR